MGKVSKPVVHGPFDEMVALADLKPHPKNRNTHTDAQIKRLAKILKYQGVRRPINVSRQSGFITTGHGKRLAMLEAGWTHGPVNYQDYEDSTQEYADVQADNAIAEWAELDLKGINQDLPDFGPELDIEMLGIKDFVLEPAEKYADKDADAIPENVEAKTKPGDLWLLGEHRLFCGDCTDPKNIERLMQGEKADMVFTDPPYGVDYAGKNAFLNTYSKGNRIEKPIESDNGSPDEMFSLWSKVFNLTADVCTDKASYYIASPYKGGETVMMMKAIDQSPWSLKHTLIWVKNNHVLGRCDYHYKHEPILYGWKKKGTHRFFGNGDHTKTVWEIPKPQKNDLHPTMKPVDLMVNAILNSTENKNKVFDPFLGSGSTLIACEKTGRKCYGMEIDPHYCDVIVTRWEEFTNKKAVLDAS